MATEPIQAVLFDMGGTLENLYYDDATRRETALGLRKMLFEWGIDPGLDNDSLQKAIFAGIKKYQAWRQESEIELSPERIWTDFILAGHDLPREQLAAAAEELIFYYETHFHLRSLRAEAPAALAALHRRGFRLAIISNVMSRQLVQRKLVEYGIDRYFGVVVTSSNLGWRKPNERIFAEATGRLQLSPAACAYVGDTISRDVIGARRAGYGLAVQIESLLTANADRGTDPVHPDAIIQDLTEVVPLVTSNTERAHDN